MRFVKPCVVWKRFFTLLLKFRCKNRDLFWSVNRNGTQSLLEASLAHNIERLVYISSSAIYGVPSRCPITTLTDKKPLEDYGRAKLAGEELCKEYRLKGLSCSIVRPRTILGCGRLGIFQILFEWVFQGKNIPVLGDGSNVFQFVHSDDLAEACLAAAQLKSDAEVNIGCDQYGSMRELLEHLTRYAGTGSAVVSVPTKIGGTWYELLVRLGYLRWQISCATADGISTMIVRKPLRH